MKHILWLVVSACVGIWAFNMGYLVPHVTNNQLTGYKEVECDEIVRNQVGVYCAVTLTTEDQPLKIYKGE
jgi:hypothetical protein